MELRTRIRTLLGRPAREHGQAMVLFALGLAGTLGLVGMSVDVGQIVYTRTQIQNAADAAALAGAQALPNGQQAQETAFSYVTKNGGTAGASTVQITQTYGANDTVRVTASKGVNYTFLRVLGLRGTTVSATAKVRAANYNGGSGLVPWGFIASNNNNSTLLQNSCYLGQSGGVPQFKQNVSCTMKYGAGTSAGGDFGSIALDATGASTYRNAIANGSTKPYKVGDLVEAQTGNMQGPTNQGIDDRFSRPAPAGCAGHARNQVLTTTDGVTSIRPGCETSPRIIIIPVVNQINNPAKSTILGFAFVYLTGSRTNGGHSQVTGEFVKFVTELPGGIYSGTSASGATTLKFVE